MSTHDEIIIRSLYVLARDVLDDDGVANSLIRDAAQRLTQLTRWVSVAESLPELGEEVLVCDAEGNRDVAWLHIDSGDWHSWAHLDDIICWMPLPGKPHNE